MELTADYSKIFGVHSINLIAGHSYDYRMIEAFNAMNSGFVTDGFQYNNLGSGTGISTGNTSRASVGSSKYDEKLASVFGRANYTLMDKYMLSATVRRDGSSKFGSNHRWGTFPAISGGWLLSSEEFMKSVTFINHLKLRVAYGVAGNLPSGGGNYYLYMQTLGTSNRVPINGTWMQTYGANRNPNADLKWEEKREFDFGIDFTIMKNRISGTIDIYNRKTVDIIDSYNAQMPPMILSTVFTNVGTMSNKGIEIGLSAKVINNRNFKYDANVSFSYQKNILVSLSNDVYKATYKTWRGLPAPGNLGDVYRTEEGQPTGGFYCKRFAGFDDTGKWLFYKADNSVVGLSAIIPSEDCTINGYGAPKYQASLHNSFKFKNIDFSIFFRGKFDFMILNCKEMYYGNTNYFPNNVLKSAITKHAELKDQPQYSDYYLEPGDFVKIDNISLGYNFPIKNREWVRSLRVFSTWQNCYTFTRYSGTNPDLNDTGFEPGYDSRGFYPNFSTLMVGLTVGF